MPVESVQLSVLVIDNDLYPRHSLDQNNLALISQAIDLGVQLPRIIVEEGSYRIVDGVHRYTVYKRKYGDQHTVEVQTRKYKDNTEFLRDSIKLNADPRGVQFQRIDRVRIAIIAEKMGIQSEVIARDLNITTVEINGLIERRTARDGKGNRFPTKIPTHHRAGEVFTDRQVEVNNKATGLSIDHHAREICDLVTSGLVDLNELRMTPLAHMFDLHKVLTDYLPWDKKPTG
jgi:ParB-like chromosome segregation protein Spo0J